jgi:hypothetical protein
MGRTALFELKLSDDVQVQERYLMLLAFCSTPLRMTPSFLSSNQNLWTCSPESSGCIPFHYSQSQHRTHIPQKHQNVKKRTLPRTAARPTLNHGVERK